jgi:hypothetical protein
MSIAPLFGVMLAVGGTALVALATLVAVGCFEPELAQECAHGVCGGISAEGGAGAGASPAPQGVGGGAAGGGVAGSGGGGSGGAVTTAVSGGGDANAASSTSGGPFQPTKCACADCQSHADCAAVCDAPPGTHACYFPAEGGCWIVAEPCPP